jgi:hypothetical protein
MVLKMPIKTSNSAVTPNAPKMISVLIREGVQQNTIDHAVDYGRGANAQGKSQDGNDSKAGTLSQRPEAITNVVPKARHRFMLSRNSN